MAKNKDSALKKSYPRVNVAFTNLEDPRQRMAYTVLKDSKGRMCKLITDAIIAYVNQDAIENNENIPRGSLSCNPADPPLTAGEAIALFKKLRAKSKDDSNRNFEEIKALREQNATLLQQVSEMEAMLSAQTAMLQQLLKSGPETVKSSPNDLGSDGFDTTEVVDPKQQAESVDYDYTQDEMADLPLDGLLYTGFGEETDSPAPAQQESIYQAETQPEINQTQPQEVRQETINRTRISDIDLDDL